MSDPEPHCGICSIGNQTCRPVLCSITVQPPGRQNVLFILWGGGWRQGEGEAVKERESKRERERERQKEG